MKTRRDKRNKIIFSGSQYCPEAKKEKEIRRIGTISSKIQRDTPCFPKIESFSSFIVAKFPECISICRVRLIFLDHRKSGKLPSLPQRAVESLLCEDQLLIESTFASISSNRKKKKDEFQISSSRLLLLTTTNLNASSKIISPPLFYQQTNCL